MTSTSTLEQQVDPEDVGVSSRHLAHLGELQRRHLAANAYQGSVMAMSRHGRVCYAEAFGKADEGVPMTTAAIFRFASMSKTIASACVMQLWERGLIGLHDPVAQWLPELADPRVAVVEDWGVTRLASAERPITVHHLLTMTAGYTNTWWHRMFEPSVYGVVPQLLADAGVVDTFATPATTLQEVVERLATVPLIAQPGTMFDYSNNSVTVLCRLVEVVSGLDFDTYQRRNVLEPLGMHETWFWVPDDERHRLAAVYWAGRDERQLEDAPLGAGMLGPEYSSSEHRTLFMGAGGLHGTTGDYLRFAHMLLGMGELDGVRVLSPASVRLMTTNRIGDRTNWQLTQNRWGYMLDVQEGEHAPDGSLHYLGGPGAYSWQGFFSTKFVVNPRADTVILTMSTPGFDGALPHNLRLVAAANAAVVD